jgi:hypothetical protein
MALRGEVSKTDGEAKIRESDCITSHFVPERNPAKCELRDVIHSSLPPIHAAYLTFSLISYL